MRKVEALVSVIIPIYRVEDYLKQCIDSVCSQTYSQLEILLIDDGSPDRCGMICDTYAAKDLRIKVVHKENGGLSSARNAGLDIAKGEYISFVDADDTIHPRFIETLLNLCCQYHCDIAQCDYLTIEEKSIRLPLNPRQSVKICDNRKALHELCSGKDGAKYVVACNKLYKKHLFKDIRYPLSRIHEDEFTTYLLLWNSGEIAVTNQYLYYYLQRDASITGKQFSVKRLDILDALEERLLFLNQNGLREEYKDTLKTMLYLIDKYYIALENGIEDNGELVRNLLKKREAILEMFCGVSEKKGCICPMNSKIVIYGAGNWGRKHLQWITHTHCGIVVGLVDNRWYAFHDIEYPVMPIDYLMRAEFDYVLLAIESKAAQQEIFENLVYWGISKEKILFPIDNIGDV